MIEKDDILTLANLGVEESDLLFDIKISKKIYDFYILHTPSSGLSIKRPYFSIKGKHFNSFMKKLSLKIKDFDCNVHNKWTQKLFNRNCIFFDGDIKLDVFFKSIRNSIAHGDVISFKGKTILFQTDRSNKNKDIKNLLNSPIKFLFILNNINGLNKIILLCKSYI